MLVYKSNDACDLFGELYGWRGGGEVAEFKAMTPNPNILICYTTQFAGSWKTKVTDLTYTFIFLFSLLWL